MATLQVQAAQGDPAEHLTAVAGDRPVAPFRRTTPA